ncbi:hypothetical protein CEXT_31721 [Caerostris extrusa]|uniref:Uncharacterized protein n=1 Tax=Caerostris extrusa TaxID=172846 RepID=A0AAV4Q0K5_CAEEX|nr:hypothetical protein CEXT_31721 [Caerostris extrusa]
MFENSSTILFRVGSITCLLSSMRIVKRWCIGGVHRTKNSKLPDLQRGRRTRELPERHKMSPSPPPPLMPRMNLGTSKTPF